MIFILIILFFIILIFIILSLVLIKNKNNPKFEIFQISKTENFTFIGKKENPTIILIMGWMCSSVLWTDSLIQKLLQKDFSLIIFNNPGMSDSINIKEYNFENICKIIDNFGIIDPIIGGWSMGAMIAFYYSITRNVKYCISICGASIEIGNKIIDPTNILQLINDFDIKNKNVIKNFTSLIYKNAVNQIIPFCEIGKQQALAMYEYSNNIQNFNFSSIKTRLLFITAENDIVVPPQKNINFLVSKYDKNLIYFHQFKNEGHGVLFTKENEIINLINNFIKKSNLLSIKPTMKPIKCN